MSDGFPSLESYLARLPNGLESYPEMGAKASLVRQIIADSPFPLASAGLPPALDALVRSPPLAHDWVHEVEFWALSLCIYDRAFAGHGGIRLYDAWSYARNRQLLGGPLYRILFAVLSPERLFAGAAQRYATFHRGTVMSDFQGSKGRAAFRLTTPPDVLPELAHVVLAAAFRAVLDVTGAQGCEVKAHAASPQVVEFMATWR